MRIGKEKKYTDLAFSKVTPSVFIFDTPFQLLCVAEAIAEFELEDYLLVAALEKMGARNGMVIEMLNDLHLNYEVLYIDDYIANDYSLLKKELLGEKANHCYSRAFIGDYFAIEQWALCNRYLTNNSVCVFLDDGNSSVSLLNGELVKGKPVNFFERKEWKKDTYNPIMNLRKRIQDSWHELGIHGGKYMFTLYSDIKTKAFVLFSNNFANLSAKLEKSKDSGVFVIGTVSFAFCHAMCIRESEYEGILWQKLSETRKKYRNDEIVYIPHGRDVNENTVFFCRQLGIKYERLNCAVEYYFLKKRIRAKSICGFGSTALLTLKKMLPEANVVNWFIDNNQAPAWKTYSKISRYYLKHGIETEKIYYRKISVVKKMKRFVKRLLRIN